MDKIPEEIVNAATLISRYFRERNIKAWVLGDCCSRVYADGTPDPNACQTRMLASPMSAGRRWLGVSRVRMADSF